MSPTERRATLALWSVSAYQAVALCTVQFVVPVYVTHPAGAPSFLATNLALFSGPYLVGFVIAHLFGALIDVTGRLKPFLLIALGAHLAGFAMLAVFRAPWAILLASALPACFTGTLNTSLKTYVTRLSEAGKGVALSRFTMAAQVGWAVGGIVTAFWLVDLTPASAEGVVLADLALTVATIALVAIALPRIASAGGVGHPAAASHASLFGGIREDLAAVYAEPALIRGCLAGVLLVAGNWVFISTFSVYVVDHLHASAPALGWLNLVGAAGNFALMPIAGWLADRRSPGAAVKAGAVGYVLCYAVMVAAPSVAGAGFVFSIPSYAALLIGLTTAASEMGGVARRGGGIGVVDGLWAIAIAIGAAAGAAIADRDAGLLPAVALCVCVAGLAVAWSAAGRIDARVRPAVSSRG